MQRRRRAVRIAAPATGRSSARRVDSLRRRTARSSTAPSRRRTRRSLRPTRGVAAPRAGELERHERHGRVERGAGAVQAARTASSTPSRGDARPARTRAVGAALRDATAARDSRNRSSSGARTRSRAASRRRVAGRRVHAADDRRRDPRASSPSRARSPPPPRRRARPRSPPARVPWWSARAAQVDQRREARAADRDVHDALAPRAAERVGDHDARGARAPSRGRAARSEPLGRRVGILREQRERTPPRRSRRRRRRSRRRSRAASRRSRGRRGARRPAPSPARPTRARSPSGDEPALGLRHDLLRDRDDVAVARRRARAAAARGARRGRRRARPPGAPRGGSISSVTSQQLASAARATASGDVVVAHDRVGDGDADARAPSRSRPRARASRSSITHAGEQIRVGARGADRRDLEADRPASACRPCPRAARRPRSADTPTTALARRGDRLADAGHREDRADRHHGVRGADHDGVRARDRLEHARAPARARSTPSNRIAFTSSRAPRRTQYSWKCRSSCSPASSTTSIRVSPGRRSSGGSRTPTPNRARDPRGHLRERPPVGRASGVRNRWVARSRSPRPNQASLGVEAPELLGRAEGLVAPAPAALAVEHVAEPVGDRVEVGGDVQAVHRRCRRRCSRPP